MLEDIGTPHWVEARPLLQALWKLFSIILAIIAECGVFISPMPPFGLAFGIMKWGSTPDETRYWIAGAICVSVLLTLSLFGAYRFYQGMHVLHCIVVTFLIGSLGLAFTAFLLSWMIVAGW